MTYACKTIDSFSGRTRTPGSSAAPGRGSGPPRAGRDGAQLRAYFAGKLQRFSLPLDFQGTAFQKSVWQSLLTIPFGETRSYAEIARLAGCAGGLAAKQHLLGLERGTAVG